MRAALVIILLAACRWGFDPVGAASEDDVSVEGDGPVIDGSGGAVLCGGSVCPVAQGCCTSTNASAGTCTTEAQCGQQFLRCDGPEDCDGGKRCCQAQSGGATCKTSCASYPSEADLCATTQPMCPDGGMCCSGACNFPGPSCPAN